MTTYFPARILVTIASISLFVFGCANRDQKHLSYTAISDSSFSKLAVTPELLVDNITFKSPTKLLFLNDVLIVADLENSDGKVVIYDPYKKKYLGSYLEYGVGEGKVLGIWEMFAGINGRDFFIYDLTQGKIIRLNIDSLKSQNYKYSEEIDFAEFPELKNIVSIEQYSEDLFVGTIMDGNGRLVYFDGDGREFYKGNLPPNFEQSSDYIYGHAYRAFLAREGNRVAVAYFFTDILDIFTIEGDSITSIHGPFGFWPEYRVISRGGGESLAAAKGTNVAYVSVTCDEKFIYGVYSGGDQGNNYILSFTWDGQPWIKYDVMNYNLSAIAIDKARNIMFGISFSGDKPEIVWCDLGAGSET